MGKMKAVVVLLILVLIGQSFSAIAQTAEERNAAVKKQLDKIPIGKAIEVKLLSEDGGKIKGKLVSVADEYFEVQSVQSGKISTEKIAFADVKSVKKRGMNVWIKVGIIWAAILIALAASGLLGES